MISTKTDEQHDEWTEKRRYLGLILAKAGRNIAETTNQKGGVTITAIAA
jgi:hypothetical protein